MKQGDKMRFIDNGDGTITDTQTGLIWQQADDGVKRTWEEAMTYAKSLDNDWRLPTVEELFCLADRTRYNPTINPIFGCRSHYYWSSSADAYNPDGAWYVYFGSGNAGWGNKHNYYNYVRCVRDA